MTRNHASARRRGSETQRTVAMFFADHGWPYATDIGAGRNGSDILGVPGLAVEVKGRRDLSLPAWLRQAAKGAGLSILVVRGDGQGPASVGDWAGILRLEDLVELLRAAGYGDEPTAQCDHRWPAELAPDAACERCGLEYGEWAR